MKNHTCTTLLILFLAIIHLVASEIVVKEENGRITISNVPTYRSSKSVKSRKKIDQVQAPSGKVMVPIEYLNKIKTLSFKYQLREDLILAVAKAESSFNPQALSRKGAAGIMQLMPATAKIYSVSNRFDVDQNLEAGIKHLKYLFDKYNSIPLALAAYNAGEEALKKYNGIPPYEETRTYIYRVMAYMGLSFDGLSSLPRKSKIFKYLTRDGRMMITDSPPHDFIGKVEVID